MSVYDEIMDAILWVAEQEGKEKEVRKIYDKIKQRNKSFDNKVVRDYSRKHKKYIG